MNKEKWFQVLELKVSESSQAQIARELGVSPTMLNQVLLNKYKGNIDTIKNRVEGRYLRHHVQCPVAGQISVDTCRDNQERPFSSTNPQRVRLYRACRGGCPHSQLKQSAVTQRIDVQSATDSRYNVEEQLAFCRRLAQGDQLHHIELLERELQKVANRLNSALWDNKWKGK
ncbi:hypothetical protein ACQKC1_11840 [Shewanella baltica]|uniref:hypothetical protein n=1 Tax=Shewanella baltica TaxID=62322 RepID=UPI003CFE035A